MDSEKPSTSFLSNSHSDYEKLEAQEWYWGDATKEKIAAEMEVYSDKFFKIKFKVLKQNGLLYHSLNLIFLKFF